MIARMTHEQVKAVMGLSMLVGIVSVAVVRALWPEIRKWWRKRKRGQ